MTGHAEAEISPYGQLWSFGVLGPLEVRAEGSSILLPAGRARAALALLILRANQLVPIEDLVACLWDKPPSTARSGVQMVIMRLRRMLGGSDRIVTVPGGYLLTSPPGDRDLDDFHRFRGLAAAAGGRGDIELQIEFLESALALWRGPALGDVRCTVWMCEEIEQLEELRVETRLRRIDLESTLGRHTASIAELRELGLRYPLREGIRSRLMTALYRGGQQADALAAYREFRTTLVDGTGIEPSPDLRAVHQAMLAGDSELSLPSAQLSSVPAPIRDADEGFGLFQLPAIPADLVGRDTPMERLRVLARPGQRVRPIVVWGAAGIGTSTLALAVAHELRPNFGDGQLYVDVASWRARNRSDSAEELAWHILGELLITCGVAPAFLPRQLAGRSALFRARIADHKVLLVIDGASEPEQVVPLLPGTASCLVLVTSRQPLLGLVGASRLRLEAMSRSEATQLVSAIAGRSVLAARSAQVREIVTRSAGIPAELRRAVRPLVLQELASVDDQANSSALSQEVTTLPRAKA